jgi:hypothetical protein
MTTPPSVNDDLGTLASEAASPKILQIVFSSAKAERDKVIPTLDMQK